MTKQLQNMKIRIKDEEHSKQVQECLFKLGYLWCARIKDFKYLDAKALYANNEYNTVTYSDFAGGFFDDQENKEVTLEDLQAMLAETSEPVVEINNTTPDTTFIKQFQDRIKGLGLMIEIYEDGLRVHDMDNDYDVAVDTFDDVLAAIKAKEQYLKVFGKGG